MARDWTTEDWVEIPPSLKDQLVALKVCTGDIVSNGQYRWEIKKDGGLCALGTTPRSYYISEFHIIHIPGLCVVTQKMTRALNLLHKVDCLDQESLRTLEQAIDLLEEIEL